MPSQFCLPPKTPAPPPVPDMTCDTPLMLVTVMTCSAVSEPTGTYPKSRALGVIRKRLVAVTVGAADAIVVKVPVTPTARSADRRAQRIGRPAGQRKNIHFPFGVEDRNLYIGLVSLGCLMLQVTAGVLLGVNGYQLRATRN